MADPHVAALCLEVQSAFANTPYPGDDQLCGSNQGDEPAEYAMELRGLRWQSVHPELLASCSAALSFLSDAGFRYFLPAFLLSDLHGYESNAEPVFYLTHDLTVSLGKPNYRVTEEDLEAVLGKERLAFLRRFEPDAGKFDWRNYAVSRFEAFTRPERLAIIRYLEHRAAIDDYDAPGIEAALAGYWRPSAAA